MRLLTCSVLLGAVLFVGAETAGGQVAGEFFANIRPERTLADIEDAELLASYFGVQPFDWCWSQRFGARLGGERVRGDWVFCVHEDLLKYDPFGLGMGPEAWAMPGMFKTAAGEIYTITYRFSAWKGETMEAFGGLTRFFGGTNDYNYALGWTRDRPKTSPPTFWTKTQGVISTLGAGSDDHANYSNYQEATPVKIPSVTPGNIEIVDDEDLFKFEARAGRRYRFTTTLGTLDDSLIRIDSMSTDPYVYWYEDDGQWDGEGSLLLWTATEDCSCYLSVIDWGRDGATNTGTYTVRIQDVTP